MAKQMLCISGSYRKQGITEQALDVMTEEATRRGWECQRVRLMEKKIEYCRNCRACAQPSGERRGECPIEDDVESIIDLADHSDALVLASPVNYYDVTAVTRAFLERLVGCAWWPWGQGSPRLRKPKATRPAVLITSSAMPALFARLFTHSMKTLTYAAEGLNTRPVDRVFVGLAAYQPDQPLSDVAKRRLRRAASRLLR